MITWYAQEQFAAADQQRRLQQAQERRAMRCATTDYQPHSWLAPLVAVFVNRLGLPSKWVSRIQRLAG